VTIVARMLGRLRQVDLLASDKRHDRFVVVIITIVRMNNRVAGVWLGRVVSRVRATPNGDMNHRSDQAKNPENGPHAKTPQKLLALFCAPLGSCVNRNASPPR
jgi:hypothetical protein